MKITHLLLPSVLPGLLMSSQAQEAATPSAVTPEAPVASATNPDRGEESASAAEDSATEEKEAETEGANQDAEAEQAVEGEETEEAPDPAATLMGVPIDQRPAVTDRSDEQLKQELARLQAEASLRQARLEAQLAESRQATALAKAQLERSEAELALQASRSQHENESALARLTAERDAAVMQAQTSEALAKSAQMDFTVEQTDWKRRSNEIEAEVERLQDERELALVANREPSYPSQPLQEDGTLVISDRRIPLNGPIVWDTAEFISSRIEFFNNQDPEKPIFIVIGQCPGGSVHAGYQILSAMESSSAPVHVVVKGMAASMAAIITTLAEESYMLPNAILLHHQMSWKQQGNITQQRQQTEQTMEWWTRIGELVANKMGISSDDFIKQMYENSVDGDWEEFADGALKLKWVNHIAQRVHETALLEHPILLSAKPTASFANQGPGASMAMQSMSYPGFANQDDAAVTITRAAFEDQPAAHLPEQLDEQGRPFVRLPRSLPQDDFYLFDPNGYYRIP